MINLKEKEIMAEWGTDLFPTVSIKCLAYNHEKYIEKALDSFLMQKTNFPFEIVVHDDASTDNTTNIIRQYENMFPNIIKPIYEMENQYSKDAEAMLQMVHSNLKGEYVALCEGDDYWTDEYKLQKQYDAMEKHPEVDMCAHAVRRINAASGKTLGIIRPESKNMVIPTENVIAGGGGFVGTNSLFYRKKALDVALPFRQILDIDYASQVQGSLRGGMLYLNDCMSDYRFMTEGSWSSKYADEKFVNEIDACWKKMTDQLDIDTDGKYHDIIVRYMALRNVDRLFRFKHFNELREYRYIIDALEGNDKRKYSLMINFPRIYYILKYMRDRIKS